MIAQTIISVMRDIDAIGKDRRNTAQGFNFRGIDDLYNELHPVMAKHGLFSFPRVLKMETEERSTKSGSLNLYRILTVEFDFMDLTGEKITVGPLIGEASDMGDKGSNKALSVAHKYALLQLFCIPTEDDKDPDATTPPENKAQPRPNATAQQAIQAMKDAQQFAEFSDTIKAMIPENRKEAITHFLQVHNLKSIDEVKSDRRQAFLKAFHAFLNS